MAANTHADAAPRLSLHVTTLVVARWDERVLLLRRARPPNVGLWSPPGGKIEAGETPVEGAAREFEEETGLVARDLDLAAIVSELDEPAHSAWLMFVYRARAAGTPRPGPEGEARWVHVAALPDLPKPPADDAIYAAALAERGLTLLQVTFDQGELVDVRPLRPPPRH